MKKSKNNNTSTGDLLGAANTGEQLVRIAQAAAGLNPAQQKFNHLTQQIAAERVSLAFWTKHADELRDRYAANIELPQQQILSLRRAIALQADMLLHAPPPGLKMTAVRARAVKHYILMLLETLLKEFPDDAQLQQLHDAHSKVSLQALRDAEREGEMAIAQSMVGELFGERFVDDQAQDAEEIFRTARERFDREQEQRQAQKARKPGKRQQAAEDAKRTATEALSQSLREIYRKLASSLHPDRETDESAKAYKTALMQRINIAYEKKDLLTLLSLQIEVEQISAESLANVPEQRMAQYNQLLSEQLGALKRQTRVVLDYIESNLGEGGALGTRTPKPEYFSKILQRRERDISAELEHVKKTHSGIMEPRHQASLIEGMVDLHANDKRHQRAQQREEAQEFDDIDALFSQFSQPQARRRGAGGRTPF